MKYFIATLLALLLVPCAFADTLDDVLAEGVLRVGVSLYEPWAMKNEDGDLYGYEIQIAKQLANDLSVDIEFVVVDWEDLIKALKGNKFDIIISGMAITPQRALQVNFTDPYGHSGVSLAANIELTSKINSLLELNSPEVKIGVVSDSISASVAENIFSKATIKTYNKIEDAVSSLLNSDIHAFIESSPVPGFLALEYPSKVDAPLSNPLLSYKTGMAINKKQQELLNYLNSWITARDVEGWLAAKHKYWFDSLDWKK